ncbi:phycobiliprotein lyase [Oscillatoria sp. CS-180]|uniref:phycobiliprotein lyase n=1 Tax=Oscillatoria sp. CS-180 TaxID=3021720 RepID=UPI00232AA4D3|nr:phycobiliprotein lyase [Oscillatoria sp. CS-180]MDB9528665.1 phycobiliprotein lyase [Oscillatoria sp. CS-180]
MNIRAFHDFFDCCIGQWTTERTYHYLTHQDVERSRTEFAVAPITQDLKQKVLTDNQYGDVAELADLPGFRLGFHTVSETGEEVSQELRMLFVPKVERDDFLEGDYLRDQAYEESRPIISHFRYGLNTRELLMTTRYTKVVSVDSITLVNPTLRIRRILNYQRPPVDHSPLETVLLAGFGVEQKETEATT